MTATPAPASAPAARPAAPVLVEAEGLLPVPGFPAGPLTFVLRPGLVLVRGGEGRGKTTLLEALAGTRVPAGGRLSVRPADAGPACLPTPQDEAHDARVARAWLDGMAARFPRWDAASAAALADAFQLGPHLDKPMYMLSTGSRRKVGLVAAAASGAALTLMDQPFAALDGASRRVLADLLAEAARDPRRAWVIADYERPATLADAPFVAVIDLGD